VEKLVYIEYLFILVISLGVAIAGGIFELRTAFIDKRRKRLNTIVAKLFSEKILEVDQFFPKKYRTLRTLLPALEEIDRKVAAPYWTFFKETVLHRIIEKEIDLYLTSINWEKTVLGLKALELAPLPLYQEKVLSLLADPVDIVRFHAIKASIAFTTYRSTKSLITTMETMPAVLQFPYRDALSKAPYSVHQFVLQIYRKTESTSEKIECLKILGIKAGLLSEAEITEALQSSNRYLCWWGILAVSNNPYKPCIDLVIENLSSGMWQLKAVAAYTIGVLHYAAATDYLIPLIEAEQFWLRFTGATALRFLGEHGMSILEAAKQSKSDLAKNIVTYMLTLPESEFQKGMRSFFPMNLDTVLLHEEVNPNVS